MLVWHTTMAYRISFSSPFRESERDRKGEIVSRKHQLRQNAPANFPESRAHFREIHRVGATGVGGLSETVNYHPLNNGVVYEFRHHVASARSLRPSETLGAATSLLNFYSTRSKRKREGEEPERQSLVLINAWLIPRNCISASSFPSAGAIFA